MQTQESMYSMLINAFINFINAAFKLIINLAEWFKAFTFIKSKSTGFITVVNRLMKGLIYLVCSRENLLFYIASFHI